MTTEKKAKPELLVTPSVGEIIQYFPNGLPPEDPVQAEKLACAAIVVALYDNPGEIAILQLGGSGMQYRQGWRYVDQVLYAEHPKATDKNNHVVKNSGTWRFPPCDRYVWHEAAIKRREEAEIMAAKERAHEVERQENQRALREEARMKMIAKRQHATA